MAIIKLSSLSVNNVERSTVCGSIRDYDEGNCSMVITGEMHTGNYFLMRICEILTNDYLLMKSKL